MQSILSEISLQVVAKVIKDDVIPKFFGAYWYIYLLCTWVELKDHHHSSMEKFFELTVSGLAKNALSSQV